jgi:SAM-dependent methyltransferase
LCHAGPLRPDVPLRQTRMGSTDPRCQDCGVRQRCPGPGTPTQAIEPLPQPISNQFDLLQTAEGAGQVCLDDGRVFACEPETWRQPDVQAAVDKGQLYLDVSDKARLDDFALDLRLLEPVPEAPQPTWRVAALQPFAAEEALLREHLRDLTGLVVDVGAGPIRYLEDLREAMRNGHLQYLAVEPDADHLARARADLPEGRMVQGTGEHLPLRDACADAVLFLRSVNHLHDLAEGLREAARVLKPGGTLLLVDNVTFGLLRTPEQLARAHAISVEVTPFEHFRNIDAPEALHGLGEVLGSRVQVQAAMPVHRLGSNQWLVRAVVLGPAVAPQPGRR